VATHPAILLVEDNPIIQKYTAQCFMRHDCDVTMAATEKAAIRHSQTSCFDLILMDIGLPDGSGWQVIESIRSDPTGCNAMTPIVIVSAHVNEAKERAMCNRLQVSMIITKPFHYEQIPLVLSLID
jgi:CheY-like chemotaxis protein